VRSPGPSRRAWRPSSASTCPSPPCATRCARAGGRRRGADGRAADGRRPETTPPGWSRARRTGRGRSQPQRDQTDRRPAQASRPAWDRASAASRRSWSTGGQPRPDRAPERLGGRPLRETRPRGASMTTRETARAARMIPAPDPATVGQPDAQASRWDLNHGFRRGLEEVFLRAHVWRRPCAEEAEDARRDLRVLRRCRARLALAAACPGGDLRDAAANEVLGLASAAVERRYFPIGVPRGRRGDGLLDGMIEALGRGGGRGPEPARRGDQGRPRRGRRPRRVLGLAGAARQRAPPPDRPRRPGRRAGPVPHRRRP
jgi:hypothetical protein